MRIGIIGAGQIGGTIVQQYTTAGHSVKMTNASGVDKLKDLAYRTGASAVTLEEVVTDVDVIVISIPTIGILKLPLTLFKQISNSTTIVDTCNYYPIRDGIIREIENGMPESEWVSSKIQQPVVKAYNTILYRSLVNSGLPKGVAMRVALPIAGDDKRAKDVVSTLINDSGFDSLDYGSLKDSWRQQPGSPVYCTDLPLSQLRKSIVMAKKELLTGRREVGLQYILKHDPEQWLANVTYNREIYESVLM